MKARLIGALLIATFYAYFIANSITWRICAYLQIRQARALAAKLKKCKAS